MGTIELITDGSNRFLDDIINGADGALIIVPSARGARSMRERLPGVFQRVEVVTISEYASAILSASGGLSGRIDRYAKEQLIGTLLHRHEPELRYFGSCCDTPGLIRSISGYISARLHNQPDGVSMARPDSAHAARRAESAEESPRQHDLDLLFSSYIRETLDKGVVDDDLVYLKALLVLDSQEKAPSSTGLTMASTVAIVGLRHVTPLTRKLLSRVCAGADRAFIRIEASVRGESRESSAEQGSSSPRGPGSIILSGDRCIDEAYGHALSIDYERLLNDAIVGMHVRRYRSRVDEVIAVARSIRAMKLSDPSIDLRGIVIALPSLAQYRSLFEEYFPLYGLPYEVSQGSPLAASPIASLVRKLLMLASNPWSRELLYSVLSSGYVQDQGIDISRLDHYARRLNLEDLSRLLEVVDRSYGGILAKEEREWLEEQFSKLSGVVERVTTLSRASDPAGLVALLVDLITDLGVASAAAQLSTDPDAGYFDAPDSAPENALEDVPQNALGNGVEDALQNDALKDAFGDDALEDDASISTGGVEAAALSGVLNALIQTRDALILYPGVDQGRLLERFRELFDRVTSETSYGPHDRSERVQIVDIAEAGEMDLPVCFALGLVDGEFPPLSRRNFLIPDTYERPDAIRESARALWHIISSSGKTFLSYPASDGSRNLSPSPLIIGGLEDAPAAQVAAVGEWGIGESVTTESDAREPAIGEPAIGEPAIGEPAIGEPAIGEPAIGEPAKGEPAIGEPAKGESAARRSDAGAIDAGDFAVEPGCGDELQKLAGKLASAGDYDALEQLIGEYGCESWIRQLRAEACRQSTDRLTEYDGHIFAAGRTLTSTPALSHTDDYESSHLAKQGRPYSITQFETYVRCPFRYLSRYVFGFQKLDEVEDELESDEVGTVVHATLCRFGRRGGFALVNSDFAGAQRLMKESVDSVFEELGIDRQSSLFVELQYEALTRGLTEPDADPGLLLRVLNSERDWGGRSTPVLFEYAFGLPSDGPGASGPALDLKGVKVAGKVDRVDITKDGKSYIVYDYKTGRQRPSLGDTYRGLSFQLPVYLVAVAELAGLGTSEIGVGCYYHIPLNDAVSRSSLFGDLAVADRNGLSGRSSWNRDFAEIGGVDGLASRILDIDRRIRSGQFHTSTYDQAKARCSWCDYSRICRHDPIRMARFAVAAGTTYNGGDQGGQEEVDFE